ncbi:MAG: PEP/pyruvate-binding domain-containing protein [Candidatus Woesearchaeota archaeon]
MMCIAVSGGMIVAYIVNPAKDNLSLEDTGIKAAALGHMVRIGLPVPPFRVLSTAFFERHAEDIGLRDKISFLREEIKDNREIAKHVSKIIIESHLSESLVGELSSAIEQLKNEGIERIDKSSSYVIRITKPYLSTKDSRVRLHLQGLKDIERAIIDSFADYYSEASIEERVSKGIDAFSFKVPLIIQEFVKPDVTGIIMSMGKDSPDQYYIVAWKGFGFEMNFHFCDHYVVDYKDMLLKRFLNNKTGDVMFFDESKNSVTRTRIVHTEASLPFLSHNDIVGLCEIYSKHKDNLGGLGIEFKIRKGVIIMVSLKDESVLTKASNALEDLKEIATKKDAVKESEVEEPKAVEEAVSSDDSIESIENSEEDAIVDDEETLMEEPTSSDNIVVEDDYEHRSLSEEVSLNVKPHFVMGSPTDDALMVDDDNITDDNTTDLYAHIDVICEKYIAINPSLEKVIRMLKDDIKSAIYNKKGG